MTAAATSSGMSCSMVLAPGRGRGSVDLATEEQVGRQADAAVLDPVGAARPDAGGDEPTGRVAVDVDAGLLEREQIVHLDRLALHAGDLADVDHLAPPAGQ